MKRAPSHPPSLSIAVVGAGVIGCIFGHLYRRAGHRVVFVDVDSERVRVLQGKGVELELPDGSAARVGGPATGYPLPADLGDFDLVQVSVKGYDTARAAEDLRPLLSPNTAVLSVQNGLGNLEVLEAVAGAERVIGGITAHSGQALGLDRVRWAGGAGPLLTIGPSVPGSVALRPLLERLAASLGTLGYAVETLADATPAVWRKLIANVSTNPIAALTGRTAAQLLSSPHLSRLVDLLAAEASGVARAKGLAFPELDRPGEFCRHALTAARDNKISMLQDVEAGRPTEIGSLNEALCREADRVGAPASAHRAVSLLVRAMEEARRENRKPTGYS